jgi:hypothetical protein
MKPNAKWTAVALMALAAATVQTMHAQVIDPVPMVHEGDAVGANSSMSYAEARFLDQRTAGDPIVGEPYGRRFTLRIFDGLEKVQIWRNAP